MGTGWARRWALYGAGLMLIAGCATDGKTRAVSAKSSLAPPQSVASQSPPPPASPRAAGRAVDATPPSPIPSAAQLASYPRTATAHEPLPSVIASKDIDRRVQLGPAPKAAIPQVEDTCDAHREPSTLR